MSDEPTAGSPATPEGDEARISALLADLGSGTTGETLPPEVAARLEETLSRLVAERDGSTASTGSTGSTGSTASVVPLRRRWAAGAVAAAAAVAVLVGAGWVTGNLGLLGSGADDSSASSSSAGSASAEDSGAQPEDESSGGKSLKDESPGADALSGGSAEAAALPRLETATFAAHVEALLEQRPSLSAPLRIPTAGSATTGPEKSTARDPAADAPTPSRGPTSVCPGPRITDGGVPNQVSVDGAPGVLVIHPLRAGRRLVEAWDCAGTSLLAKVTLRR